MTVTNPSSLAQDPAVIGTSGGAISFYGAAAVARPAALVQTYATAARTHPAVTSAAVTMTEATAVTPFGFAQAQANEIPVAINALRADLLSLKNLVNALIDDLQAVGLSQ